MIPGKSLSSVSVSRLFYCSGDMSSITDLEIINHYGCGLVLVARAAIQSLLHRSDRSCVNFFFQILSIIYILRASDSIKSASKVDSTTLQRLWSRGYDSRLGLSSDIKCERSQVRVLATAFFCLFGPLYGVLVGRGSRNAWAVEVRCRRGVLQKRSGVTGSVSTDSRSVSGTT